MSSPLKPASQLALACAHASPTAGWSSVFDGRPALERWWAAVQGDEAIARVVDEMRGGLKGWEASNRWDQLGITAQVMPWRRGLVLRRPVCRGGAHGREASSCQGGVGITCTCTRDCLQVAAPWLRLGRRVGCAGLRDEIGSREAGWVTPRKWAVPVKWGSTCCRRISWMLGMLAADPRCLICCLLPGGLAC